MYGTNWAGVQEALHPGKACAKHPPPPDPSQLDTLTEVDDEICQHLLEFLESDAACGPLAGMHSTQARGLTAEGVAASVRRAVLRAEESESEPILPLLMGSAYKDKGVQALLDAVGAYLPSPLDRRPELAYIGAVGSAQGKRAKKRHSKRNDKGKKGRSGKGAEQGAQSSAGDGMVPVPHSASAPLCAFVFKVGRHPTRGVLSYFRVYSGAWSDKFQLLNTSRGGKERASKLLQLFADDTREVSCVPAGHIGAAVGLTGASTGDTLVLAGDPDPLHLPGLDVPAPVFTLALETESLSHQAALEEALAVLVREDPSLHVSTSDATGQMLLSGMGALHLEVAVDRLLREHGVAVATGRMMVAYRETAIGSGAAQCLYDRSHGDKPQFAVVSLRLRRMDEDEDQACAFSTQGFDDVAGVALPGTESSFTAWECDPDSPPSLGKGASPALLSADQAQAVHNAVGAWFERGPNVGAPLQGIEVQWLPEGTFVNSNTSPAALAAATATALEQALAAAESCLMEPIMAVHIRTSERHVGSVLNDLTGARRGSIVSVDTPTSERGMVAKPEISALVPVAEMVTYSTILRSLTAGDGAFSMAFHHYADVPPNVQAEVLEEAW